jgi:hypothetical protein
LPDLSNVGGKHRFTANITVQEILVERIGELDHDVGYRLDESWMSNQLQAKLGILARPVSLSKCNQVGVFEGADHVLYGVWLFHLTPAYTAEQDENRKALGGLRTERRRP